MAEVVNSPEVQKSAYLNSNLSPEQETVRKKRNIAIAIGLIVWVALVFGTTIVRLGENALQPALM